MKRGKERVIQMGRTGIVMAAMLAMAGQASGDEGRDLCPDRPGLGTPACTVEPGQIVAEMGLVDWTRDQSGGVRSDGWTFGDALLRFGVNETLEVQVGRTMLGHVREVDRVTGERARATQTGDVTLAVRQNLRNPDGAGTSVAIMPYVTLPTGGSAVGAGDWGVGLIVPVSFDLGAASLSLTPHVDAAVDGDGKGRHLAYGSVVGLGFGVSDTVSVSAELSLTRDRDPSVRSTEALAGLSAGWTPDDDSQWDVGANVGLNKASPDIELYVGYARRF